MPTRKASKKSGAKKAGAKKAGSTKKAGILTQRINVTQVLAAIIRRREWVMYGQPIFNVIATGNLADMRRVSQATRTHLADVQNSINKLDAAIRAKGTK